MLGGRWLTDAKLLYLLMRHSVTVKLSILVRQSQMPVSLGFRGRGFRASVASIGSLDFDQMLDLDRIV